MILQWLSIGKTLSLLFVFWININESDGKKQKTPICPVGFQLAFTKQKEEPICYRKKGPEVFADMFNDCVGNLFSSSLYNSLNIANLNTVIWTEYKTIYPGGPFIDWSYSSSIGRLLFSTYDVNYNQELGLHEDLCLVIDPVSNFTATKCDEKHYRYCFLKPYPDEDEMTDEGCGDLWESWRFSSPRPTCLSVLSGVSGGPVRATWRQAQELCEKNGGSILNRGWRNANNPMFQAAGYSRTYPLGIIMSSDFSMLRYDAEDDHCEIPESEWNFEDNVHSADTLLGSLHDNFWYLVNSSYIFYDVICERSIQMKNITMNVTLDRDNKLLLRVNDSLRESDVYCFSDSVIHYPTRIKVHREDDTNVFELKPITDGYYWCVHTDTETYQVAESNKVLFIREKQSVGNVYATKIRLKKPYNFENLEKSYRQWLKKLKEFVFYRTKYTQIYGEESLYANDTQKVLKQFKSVTPGLDWKDKEIIHNSKIKRLYLDGRTALLHIELNSDMMPVMPGWWEDMEVEYMKPAYYCKGFDSVPTLKLGESTTTSSCRTYQCVGDFNEGVQWVTTATESCTTRTPLWAHTTIRVHTSSQKDMVQLIMPTVVPRDTTRQEQPHIREPGSESSEESTEKFRPKPTPPPPPTTTEPTTTECQTETTEAVSTDTLPPITTVPTTETTEQTTVVVTTEMTTTKPPEEQLQQILEDLDRLLSNETGPILVESIDQVFDQVDDLLNVEDQLDIPGNLLHMLDKLGSAVYLNGSINATAVRGNIALVMADAKPNNPVRGLRIAASNETRFNKNSFEVLSEELNSSTLNVEDNEAVVHLPQSVAESSRRISFVVFRNDRAFASAHHRLSVNSRVLSVNVENITQFGHGEVVDIHINPLTRDPDRNLSRACAYWHFVEDGTGYWSQEGCTFIRATQSGLMDTCRCDHLTHFAEILVPRPVFSQRDEDILEILSIIGCCVSLLGLLMVGLTAAMFRTWRRDYSNKIWLQLCIAVFLLVVCFLIVVFAKFNEYNVGCMLLGVALHYSVLASFCWMLVAAVLSYRRLVLVFTRDASHKLLRASAFSWGAPCAVVGILLSISPHSYAGRFEEKTPSGAFCYPSGLALWLAVYAPIVIMLLANWTLFCLIVRSVFASRRIQRHGDSNEAMRCASVSCLLVFLFGLPWIFGLFAFNIVAAYLFTFTVTFQGFILFLFFVLGNKKTRDLWLNKLKITQTRKVPVTSSTYSNRSTGAGWRGNPALMDSKNSKPRSLSSPDDSRFS
ncbi:adhesion G-protein coupled receptor G2 isoform X1 [Papilio machaon]|uniref:adhesion G-protein coupled receptor G2 isoform X1 n=1 Tax=Papilio machaon TaxID=76193 RepID=UPI001E662B49|nr:adhesion G-protein coupled receptor G2 isoform X1 [Papilio machaon]